MKSGYYKGSSRKWVFLVKANKVRLQNIGVRIVLVRNEHLSYWKREEKGKGGFRWE